MREFVIARNCGDSVLNLPSAVQTPRRFALTRLAAAPMLGRRAYPDQCTRRLRRLLY
jgi:hypothetical protein